MKKLLVANLAREAQARAEAARRGGLDLFPCRTQVGVGVWGWGWGCGCVGMLKNGVCALLALTCSPLTLPYPVRSFTQRRVASINDDNNHNHPPIHTTPPTHTHTLSTRQVLSDPHLLGNILSSFVRLPGQPAAPPPPPDGPPQVNCQ